MTTYGARRPIAATPNQAFFGSRSDGGTSRPSLLLLNAEGGGSQEDSASLAQPHWLDHALPAADPLGHDARMTLCPRCQGPIPKDAERPTGNTVYCRHCDALLVRSGDDWVEVEPTP
jgi:hypothetical protein